jgi:adenine phosphoribosyltransferase
LIRNVPDFPKPGIQFKDVTTLLKNGAAFHQVIDHWKTRFETLQLNAIVGAEARGFIFGAALAYALQLPFVPARKPGKLPSEFISEEYELEYGVERLEMHVDALKPADRVVIVDDLLATGGTVCAIAKMVERLGAEIVEVACVVELPPLKGREKLKNYEVTSLVEFMVD